jgi:hypothetical protein
MKLPYSNLIIVAILSLLLSSSVIFTAMSQSSLISNQIESLFADDKDKINFFLANINDGSRNVLLEQASAQESESDVAEEEEDVVVEEEEEEEVVVVEEEEEEDVVVVEEDVVVEEQPAEEEEESSTDAQEEEENVPSPPPQENIGNKTVGSPRNQSIPTPIPIDNSNSTNATTTVPINNNTNTTRLNGTLGNPITISKTFPLKGTSGLDVTITITPIINGPELSGVTNVRKESDGPANPPLYQEFSYYMPFSMLPSEHQREILAANPGTVAQGPSSSPSSLPSSSSSPSEIAPAAAAVTIPATDGSSSSSSSTYNRQTAEGVTPALLTATTKEEDSGGGQLGEGNKDNDSNDIVPVQSLGGLTEHDIKLAKVLIKKGIQRFTNVHDALEAIGLTAAYLDHLEKFQQVQDCLNKLPDSGLTGAGNTRQERQQYIDIAKENAESMFKKKFFTMVATASVGFHPVGDVLVLFYIEIIGEFYDKTWDANIKNALAIARLSAGCKEFPTSMEILYTTTQTGSSWSTTFTSVARLQFPKVGPESESIGVTGTGKIEGIYTHKQRFSSGCVEESVPAKVNYSVDAIAYIGPLFGQSSSLKITIGRGLNEITPPMFEHITSGTRSDGSECSGYSSHSSYVNNLYTDILPPMEGTISHGYNAITTWKIVSVDY